MAINDGKSLEDVVALIEGMGLQDGFKVERRQVIRNDDGTPSAELDILISGWSGSVPTQVLIECRDRPSDGPQGVSWIEQLQGRKQRLGLSDVVGVSSTGFSSVATEEAKRLNVHLRTMNSLTADDIRPLVGVGARPPLICPSHHYSNYQLQICAKGTKPTDPAVIQQSEPKLIPLAPTDRCFLQVSTGKKMNIVEFCNLVTSGKNDLYVGLVPGGESRTVNVIVGEDIANDTLVINDSDECEIVSMSFDADISLADVKMPLHSAKKYMDGDKEIGTIMTWEGQPGEALQRFTVILKKLPDRQ